MNQISKRIQPEGQFNLKLALNYLKLSNSAVLEKVENDRYSRVFVLQGKPFLVTMTDLGTSLDLCVQGEGVTRSILFQAEAKMRRIFSMDKDPLPFLRMASKDRILHEVTDVGIRPVLLADPYESLLWSIIGQQVNTTFAKKLKHKLIELCRCNITINGENYGYLPTAQQISEIDPIELQENHFSSQKISYLLTTAEAVVFNELSFEEIPKLSVNEAMKYLTSFRGIGRWTAECILMRGIGFDDIFPAGDVGLQTISAAYYGGGKKLLEEDLRTLSDSWKPWRSWAAFLWWNCLQNQIANKANNRQRSGEL